MTNIFIEQGKGERDKNKRKIEGKNMEKKVKNEEKGGKWEGEFVRSLICIYCVKALMPSSGQMVVSNINL